MSDHADVKLSASRVPSCNAGMWVNVRSGVNLGNSHIPTDAEPPAQNPASAVVESVGSRAKVARRGLVRTVLS